MDVEVTETRRLKGHMEAPPSKTYTHRAIILAGLGIGRTKILSPLVSGDTLATIEAVREMGAEVHAREDSLVVEGVGGEIETPAVLNVANSGTTMGIMASVFSLRDKKVVFKTSEQLQRRRMSPLLDALQGAGVKTESNDGSPPFSVQGPIKSNSIVLKDDISSQFLSGLLMACPLRKNDTEVYANMDPKRQPYIQVTLDILDAFGAKISRSDPMTFDIPGNQSYSCSEYQIEGSYSSAAYILAASAITEDSVTVRNLKDGSCQGDKFFIELLKMMDANVRIRGGEVTVSGGKSLRGIEADLSQAPELFNITAATCALARGRTTITNVAELRSKGFDRISAMAQGLRRMGSKVEEKPDGLVIEGSERLAGATVDSFGDHRVAIALMVAGLRAAGKTVVKNAEGINAAYPSVINDLTRLGANLRTVY